MTDTPQLTHAQAQIASGDWSAVYEHINFNAPEHDITSHPQTRDISQQPAA